MYFSILSLLYEKIDNIFWVDITSAETLNLKKSKQYFIGLVKEEVISSFSSRLPV